MISPTSLTTELEQIRAKYKLPALGGAIFTADGMEEMAITGVRKSGAKIPATTEDKWHLGSDTKMMTALLAGALVAEGKLSWEAKVLSFFPEIADRVPKIMRDSTLGQVLAHQAGLVEKLSWQEFSGSVTKRRQAAAREALLKPASVPGSYHYANTGYVVAAAIMETITS